jgi:hypothetical protein
MENKRKGSLAMYAMWLVIALVIFWAYAMVADWIEEIQEEKASQEDADETKGTA